MRRKIANTKRRAHSKCRRYISGILPLILVASYAICGFAAQEADNAGDNAGQKLAEGVGETATGWTEAPKQIVETSQESNPVEGVTAGAIQGAGEAVVATTEGAVKAATFYIPDEEKGEGEGEGEEAKEEVKEGEEGAVAEK